MDITEFKSTKQTDKSTSGGFDSINTEDFDKVKNEYGDMIELFLTKYGEMSEEELIKEMLGLIAQKKREGTFDATKIREAANKISPLLTDEQRLKMQSLLNYLD